MEKAKNVFCLIREYKTLKEQPEISRAEPFAQTVNSYFGFLRNTSGYKLRKQFLLMQRISMGFLTGGMHTF